MVLAYLLVVLEPILVVFINVCSVTLPVLLAQAQATLFALHAQLELPFKTEYAAATPTHHL